MNRREKGRGWYESGENRAGDRMRRGEGTCSLMRWRSMVAANPVSPPTHTTHQDDMESQYPYRPCHATANPRCRVNTMRNKPTSTLLHLSITLFTPPYIFLTHYASCLHVPMNCLATWQ